MDQIGYNFFVALMVIIYRIIWSILDTFRFSSLGFVAEENFEITETNTPLVIQL